jgi:hypothetical protein
MENPWSSLSIYLIRTYFFTEFPHEIVLFAPRMFAPSPDLEEKINTSELRNSAMASTA